ncbi:MAG: hypothetical protein IPK79_03660 [Vampirovibrionales bacterium]|nr:hypothetical protein [Vampirovibrionales bacterium]
MFPQVQLRRPAASSSNAALKPKKAASLFGLEALVGPVDEAESADLLASSSLERQTTAAAQALEDLEEKYNALVESIDVEKFNPAYISRYIKRAETRRGAPYADHEKKRFREMAKSGNPNLIRLLALELRIGIPKKIERDALAAMGRLMLHRDQAADLRGFLDQPDKDPNLRNWVQTMLTMNTVEQWMGALQRWRESWAGLWRRHPREKGRDKRRDLQATSQDDASPNALPKAEGEPASSDAKTSASEVTTP